MDEFEDEKAVMSMTCAAVYLLQGDSECWVCKKQTRMFALMALPPLQCHGYDIDSVDKDGSMLNALEALPETLVRAIAPTVGRGLRVDHSGTRDESYWMNHCEHCDAKQGDHFVHGPNGPFWPNDDEDKQAVQASRIDGPFEIPGEHSGYSGAMAAWRDWKHGVQRPKGLPRKRGKPRAKG